MKKINNIRFFIEKFKTLAALLYIFGYGLIVMFSIPVASLLTLVSGYVFGGLIGGFIAFMGALMGASTLFVIVRAGLKLDLEERLRSSSVFVDFREEIFRNQFRYLLFLRVFPIFPFWVVNLAPAILGVKFKIFFFTTLLGILPGTFIIAGIGEKIRIVSAPSTELVHELMSNLQFIFLSLVLSAIIIFPPLLKFLRLKRASLKKKP